MGKLDLGYYILSTMSPLVPSLMMLLVMVLNTKASPLSWSLEYVDDESEPCNDKGPWSCEDKRIKRAAKPCNHKGPWSCEDKRIKRAAKPCNYKGPWSCEDQRIKRAAKTGSSLLIWEIIELAGTHTTLD